ncbi:unnamed protein product [Cladocopium goreaui]|uniref:Steroid 5-alpha reductase C-terminal domain-containing protein n=1 Tax=Cladocopium goreaui TaxID=2562237 RepID=A0A9P1BZ99_9DINO|nr:unnamed protein product [Cladocopium goreaui]
MHESHERGLEDGGFAATQMLDLNPVQARQELSHLRAGLADSQARHKDTALLLERLSGQNATLRSHLRDAESAQAQGFKESPMNREGLRNISNTFHDHDAFRTSRAQKPPLPSDFQTPRRTASSTPSSAGRKVTVGMAGATEIHALRHRVWELERNLENEKRRNALLKRHLDQSSCSENKNCKVKEITAERKLLADAETEAKALAQASSLMFLEAQASLAGQLQQELCQEIEAVRLLHREEMRLANSEQALQRRATKLQEELVLSQAASASCQSSLQAAQTATGEHEAFSALLRSECRQAEASLQHSREEEQIRRRQASEFQKKEAEYLMAHATFSADRARWQAHFERSMAEAAQNYHAEVLAVRSNLLESEEEASKASRTLAEQLAHLKNEVEPVKTKLEEVSAENSMLIREGHRLQEQLVESLMEASRGGDRLLASWERCNSASQEIACLKQEVAQAREDLAEVSEALAEEQAQASDLRCRMRESGLMPPLVGAGPMPALTQTIPEICAADGCWSQPQAFADGAAMLSASTSDRPPRRPDGNVKEEKAVCVTGMQ